MSLSTPHLLLRLLAALCFAAGLCAWGALAWKAISDLDGVTPESDTGGRLLGWALTGTVLMIAGMILLHFAADAAERREDPER